MLYSFVNRLIRAYFFVLIGTILLLPIAPEGTGPHLWQRAHEARDAAADFGLVDVAYC